MPAVQDFVEAQLGRKFVEPPTFDLSACHADSSPTTPLIFVLSAGSDPTAALLQFAAERDMSSRSVCKLKSHIAFGNWLQLEGKTYWSPGEVYPAPICRVHMYMHMCT